MRARFLFEGGELWETVFSIFTTYPLLIPGTIARIWYYIGSDTTIVPIIVAFLFTFSTVGLLYSSVSILRGRSQGVLAGLLLLSTVIFLQSGMNQVGDVPVGFFYLATIVLFYLNDNISTGEKGFMLILAGITTGLASWTKAEGNLLMVSIVVASTLIFLPKKGFKKYIKDLLIWGIGLIPILAVVIYFKTQITSPSYITDQGWTGIIDKLTDPTRYLIITQIMVEKLVAFGDGALFLLALYLILMGKKYIIRDDIITFSIIVLCFMLIGYFSIYLINPIELSFTVQVSFKRLFLQLWPTIIFVSFMIVKPPIIINDCSVAENMDKLVSVKNQC
jgi:4-amino-4-deoxy-L-arabinose transferase-like glycosyltransferase